MPAGRDATTVRVGVAALAGVAGLLMIGASFLPWISAATEDGGSTSITGWGGITGASSIAGTNLNDVLDGDGTYRPGLIGLIFGVLTVIAAIAIASGARGARPHRITAALLTLCGLVTAGWGLFRALSPGDANVFEAGETTSGLGPWCTAAAGVLAIAAAVLIFAGRIDPPSRSPRRPIQPR